LVDVVIMNDSQVSSFSESNAGFIAWMPAAAKAGS